MCPLFGATKLHIYAERVGYSLFQVNLLPLSQQGMEAYAVVP